MNTEEGLNLLDQIAALSKPIVILSGGEPLLRDDIYELGEYGTSKGLKMVMGTNGTLIDDNVAKHLLSCGIERVSISLDSSNARSHDEFRGKTGCFDAAIKGIKACIRNGVHVQINTTVTRQNYHEIEEIFTLSKELGADAFHLFFLVPTGRGEALKDLSPIEYERMLRKVLSYGNKYGFEIKPTCAPQYMRIAKQMGISLARWGRGCIAGLYYCRIYPTGEVTPCPYLPIQTGNVRNQSFRDIWFHSPILQDLRDFSRLKGKCCAFEYVDICGGSRARAYGLTKKFVDACGGLQSPTEVLEGDYLAEEPWCLYQPVEEG